MLDLHACCVKCSDCLGEGQVSKVRKGCILGLCEILFIKMSNQRSFFILCE